MPRDPERTRSHILDSAQPVILRRGFAATSVDDIQEAAGISRGTFFNHFPSKDEFARAVIAHYAEQDRALVDGLMARAEKLVSDPLQQALLFVGLHEELFEEVPDGGVGCLFASYSYEAGLFDAPTEALVRGAIEHWRDVFGGKLRQAMARHPARIPDVDPMVLADVGYGVLQGAFILTRTMDDPRLMAEHVRQFRCYLELLFDVLPVGATGPSRTREGARTAGTA